MASDTRVTCSGAKVNSALARNLATSSSALRGSMHHMSFSCGKVSTLWLGSNHVCYLMSTPWAKRDYSKVDLPRFNKPLGPLPIVRMALPIFDHLSRPPKPQA